MIIIGIDPGHTTGYVVIEDQDESPGFSIVEVKQISWDERFSIADKLLAPYDQSVGPVGPTPPEARVVCESFNLYPTMAAGQAHIRSSFPSVEVIGIVSYSCHLYHIRFSQQPPSVRSRVQVLPDHKDLLRGQPHATDAYRHARYYLLHLKKNNLI
jgi:hypothetical protein